MNYSLLIYLTAQTWQNLKLTAQTWQNLKLVVLTRNLEVCFIASE